MRLRLLLISLLFLGTALCARAGVIRVCSSCTIRDALARARDGDTVLVNGGIHYEAGLEITRRIALIGTGRPVIDGQNKGTILTVLADSVTISGFRFQNVLQSYTKDFAAIRAYKATGIHIRDNVLRRVFFGILIEQCKHGIIEANTISSLHKDEASAGNGVHIWKSAHMKVLHNEIFNMRDGIYFEFVKRSRIAHNFSHDNIRYGLHFMFSNNDKYMHNRFARNGAGVAVMFSKRITMTDNIFFDNWGDASYGLLLKEIYDARIRHNIFRRNTIAINLEGSTRIDYRFNDFLNNGWAVRVTGACYQNEFIHNNFISNSFDISYNGQVNNNKFEQNYWSEYSGYDLDKDGIGDVPFRPVKLFSYVVNHTPETIVLMRSLFVDLLNFSEKVSPVFTPDNLIDPQPLMKPVHDRD